MSAPALQSDSGRNPFKSSLAPSVSMAQWLAFAAFVIYAACLLGFEKKVVTDEADELRRLCIFLIAALLPSDALIRFGRSRLMGSLEQDEEGDKARLEQLPKEMTSTTLPQLLAFCAFVAMCLAAVVAAPDPERFGQIAEVASYLVAALLPSEATIRFGRSLWLKNVKPNEITETAAQRI